MPTTKQHIKAHIEAIELDAQLSFNSACNILLKSECYYAKHYASSIKAKSEDILKMTAVLKELLKQQP